MIELKIKTPTGEKEFKADDITFGALEECVKLEGLSDVEAMQKFPTILKLIFPDLTSEDIKYIGMKQIMKLVKEDIKKLMFPVEDAVKN